MPDIFPLIGQSWSFCRKQPVLLHIGIWLLFVPLTLINLLTVFLNMYKGQADEQTMLQVVVIGVAILLLGLLIVWGMSCVLVVGSRLLAAKAGRARTSFKAVRTEARAFVVPIILTSILRSVATILWGILLIIPGIIYSIRTAFYLIIIIQEGLAYRPALRRSSELVRGHTGQVFVRILFLSICLFAPIKIIDLLPTFYSMEILPALGITVLTSALSALALILFTMSTIQMYEYIRPATKPVTGGGKKKASSF